MLSLQHAVVGQDQRYGFVVLIPLTISNSQTAMGPIFWEIGEWNAKCYWAEKAGKYYHTLHVYGLPKQLDAIRLEAYLQGWIDAFDVAKRCK